MTPEVYSVFEMICLQADIRGPVLEIGSVPGPDSLLRMHCLQKSSQRIGINLDKATVEEDYQIIQGNANEMSCFEDGHFELVICNATLEHDPYFWRTLNEIHRVTASKGLIIIGVPGFSGMGITTFAPRKSILGKILRLYAKMFSNDVLLAGTVTLGEHFFPGDYYRFTEQAVREIFLAGLNEISVRKVMNPPRIIGWGWKP